MAGMCLHRQRHIVEHAEIEEQRRDLERARQPERAAGVHRQPRDVAAGEMMRPESGASCAAELRDQRGFSGAVRPDHGVQFAFGIAKRDRRWRRCRRSAWRGFRPAASQPWRTLPQQAVDAASREQHHQQQQRPEYDLPIFGDAGQHLLQHQQRHRAEQRAE